jgi:hypothetical protein
MSKYRRPYNVISQFSYNLKLLGFRCLSLGLTYPIKYLSLLCQMLTNFVESPFPYTGFWLLFFLYDPFVSERHEIKCKIPDKTPSKLDI